ISAGKWEISTDDDEGIMLQRLKWWHPEGEHELTVKGVIRKHNIVEGSAEEAGYLEQCQQSYGFNLNSCNVM
ncbi:hypothetical protein J8I33_34350, partial [Burkholderia sp. AcTa6-5]